MGREIKRVSTDFDWPLYEVWQGFLMPDKYLPDPCPDCSIGYSPEAQHMYDLWYGYAPFDPESTGSTPWRHDSPAVRACAERNVHNAPEYYGRGEEALPTEVRRLAALFNEGWSHHLSQDDVDALAAAGRLRDFTHTWSREHGWQREDPPVTPTAQQVNEWSLVSFGHDALNAGIAVEARCARGGLDPVCPTCHGYAGIEAYPGQRAEADAWRPTDPPTGDGWQLWETVSEGSPISPVFATADDLATWMSDPARGGDWVPGDVARKFIRAGWAPTGVMTPSRGVVSGVEYIGTRERPGGSE